MGWERRRCSMALTPGDGEQGLAMLELVPEEWKWGGSR
jgi:hypothetical protein